MSIDLRKRGRREEQRRITRQPMLVRVNRKDQHGSASDAAQLFSSIPFLMCKDTRSQKITIFFDHVSTAAMRPSIPSKDDRFLGIATIKTGRSEW